ncbi:MAG: metal-dependent hydrolase [Saprospiraceae bacterium]
MTITYFGHSCFLIESMGFKLLFDPFIKGNPLATMVKVDEIQADYIFLTHGHGDHVGDSIEIALRTKAKLISTYEVSNYLGLQGIVYYALNIGGKIKLDFGTVKLVTAQHSSSLPDGSYGANPCGFVVWNEEICFYVSGDTGLTLDMKLIPMTCPPLDFAVLCIGDIFTMGYEDAFIASEFIQCNKIIACHFDTFPPILIDHASCEKYFSEKGKSLIIPKITESIKI